MTPEAEILSKQMICKEPGRYIGWPTIVRTRTGELLIAFSGDRDGHICPWGKMEMVRSSDEGKTWSKPQELPGALTGDRHQCTYVPDGRLFVSFRDRGHETPTPGDWVGWVGTFEDLEEGREGQYRVRLKDNHKGADCAYPTQHLLHDGTVFAATYGHWTPGEHAWIIGYHFKIEQLDELVDKRGR